MWRRNLPGVSAATRRFGRLAEGAQLPRRRCLAGAGVAIYLRDAGLCESCSQPRLEAAKLTGDRSVGQESHDLLAQLRQRGEIAPTCLFREALPQRSLHSVGEPIQGQPE